ncbi:Nucleoside transporter [Novymonas esmeraldas]|uniref:Nucleoside transporter n=1 Tax=Novymonas esmeraldas TaxID=1808958 RepID=A0AAW0F363_9TRYP
MSLEVVLIYASAAVLGLCCLFAYNSFLSSPTYLEHYYQFAAVKHTDDVSTLPAAKNKSFWTNISTWVTVLMMVPMFLLQFLMLSPWVLRQKVQHRMIVGAALSLMAVLIVPVCAASGGVSEGASMAVLIVACLVTGGATTTLESALYAFFGSLPTKYMTGFVMGGGFSGSINSVLRIVITVGLPPTFAGVKTSAVIFFSIGMALMVVTVALAVLMGYSPMIRSYCRDYRRPGDVARCAHEEDAAKARARDLDHATPENSHSMQEPAMEQDAEEMMCAVTAAQKLDDEITQAVAAGESASNDVQDPREEEEEEGEPSVFAVARKIWPMMVCLSFNMFTTLVLFPGIGLHAMHQDPAAATDGASADTKSWAAESLMPMVIILMFNGGDTIGRLVANFRRLWCPERFVPVVVIARAIACVIPLALGVCTPKVINSNANPIVVFLVLGITNGYLIGLTMAYGSSDPRLTNKERAISGACLCFALLVGTTSGSVLSLLILTFAM